MEFGIKIKTIDMKAETRAFIEEYKTHKEWEKKCKSNLINMNDYFTYSGKIEHESQEFKNWQENYKNLKAPPRKKTCRKEYFREYWKKYKLNQI